MNEPSIPERQGLELSFVRARFLATAALAILLPLGGYEVAAIAALIIGTIAGNGIVWRLTSTIHSLTGQRRLGVAAVILDAAVVFAAGLAAPATAATAAFGALVIVVAEASVRFAPIKAAAATIALVGGLAVAMLIRDFGDDDPFEFTQFSVIALLTLLAGTMIGSAVREVYRHRVAMPESVPAGSEPDVPPDAAELLTPRERQVLSFIVRGYSNAGIAEALVIEPKTVKNHINRVYGKLQISSRYEAIIAVLGQRRDDR
jgi:DNA-binding NarL/FixJ family response regulator